MIPAIAVGASLAADLSWYVLGRWRETQTLKTLGRVSPIAGTSVHRVRHIFAAHREAFQVSARFLPELNAIVAGLAGASKVSIVRFVCHTVSRNVTGDEHDHHQRDVGERML